MTPAARAAGAAITFPAAPLGLSSLPELLSLLLLDPEVVGLVVPLVRVPVSFVIPVSVACESAVVLATAWPLLCEGESVHIAASMSIPEMLQAEVMLAISALSFVFDTLVFGLTILKTYQLAKSARRAGIYRGLSETILRDGEC